MRILLFLLITNIYAQNSIKIEYALNYAFDNIEDLNLKNNPAFEEIKDTYLKSQKYITFSLIFKSNKSIFLKNDLMFDDKLNDYEKKIISILENEIYFFDSEANVLYEKIKFENKDYVFSLNPNENKWEILDETKKIDSFNCIKAKVIKTVNGKDVTYFAWFTPELPFQTGPKDFIGLPGVILEVSNGNYSFVAKSINLNPSDAELSKVVMPNGNLISKEEFSKIVQKARANFGY